MQTRKNGNTAFLSQRAATPTSDTLPLENAGGSATLSVGGAREKVGPNVADWLWWPSGAHAVRMSVLGFVFVFLTSESRI